MPQAPGAPMPPQGAAAPSPQGPPPGAPPQGPQHAGGAEQMVSQIHAGITGLKPMIGAADPQLKQAYMGLASSFQAFLDEAGKPHGAPQAPQPPSPPRAPMPPHASAGAKPMPAGM